MRARVRIRHRCRRYGTTLFPGIRRPFRRPYIRSLLTEAIPKRVRERRRHTRMFGNLFGGSGSKSGSKASASAPGVCPESPLRRPRGSRDDVPSPFRPVRASSRTISYPSRDAAVHALPFRHDTDTISVLSRRTPQASAPGPTAAAASGASAAPRASAGASGVRSPRPHLSTWIRKR